jgi:hypothetical protein
MKATKRTKKAAKKSKGMKKGKSLESVKPLTKLAAGASANTMPTESVSFNFGNVQRSYGQQ